MVTRPARWLMTPTSAASATRAAPSVPAASAAESRIAKPRPRIICARSLRLGQGDQQAARRVVEERRADGALPPARGERSVLVVAEHDQVGLQLARKAADLLHRLADREVPGGREPLVGK